VAQAYNVATDLLISAETARLAAIVLRRTHHRAGAQRMILQAAEQLEATTKLKDPRQATEYAQLLATAAYTAAINDQRDTANTLLTEAATARQLVSVGGREPSGDFRGIDLAVYRIGIARALGDYGTAVQYAQRINPAQITSPSRRARYWEDTALSLHGRGLPQATYQALLAAEKDTPEEVRYRPWAQQLTRHLVAADNRHTLPGIRGFAGRIGVNT
jgi:hypothetical protein